MDKDNILRLLIKHWINISWTIVLVIVTIVVLNTNAGTDPEVASADNSSDDYVASVRAVVNEQRIRAIEDILKTTNDNIIILTEAINNKSIPSGNFANKNDLVAIVNNLKTLEDQIKDMRTAFYRSNYLNINVEGLLSDVEYIRSWMAITDNVTAELDKKLTAHTENKS